MAPGGPGSPAKSSPSRGSLRRSCPSRYKTAFPNSLNLDEPQVTSAPVVNPPAGNPPPAPAAAAPAAAAAPRGDGRAAAPADKRPRVSRPDQGVAAPKAKAPRRDARAPPAVVAPPGGDEKEVDEVINAAVAGLDAGLALVTGSTPVIDLQGGTPPPPVPPDGGQLPVELSPPEVPDPVGSPGRPSTGKMVKFRTVRPRAPATAPGLGGGLTHARTAPDQVDEAGMEPG